MGRIGIHSPTAGIAIAALVGMCASITSAQTPQPLPPVSTGTNVTVSNQVMLQLANGETIKGTIKLVTHEYLILIHQVLGEVKIPLPGITSSEPGLPPIPPPPPLPPPPPPPAAKPANPLPNANQIQMPMDPVEAITGDDDKSFWEGWSRSVEFGLNGTTGPIDSQTVRLNFSMARSSAKLNTTAHASYVYGQNNYGTTQNRGEINARNDWKFAAESPWSMWTQGRLEIDDKQAWDARIGGAVGFGYSVTKTEKTTILARLGLGGAREINGENALIPELGIFAVDGHYKVSDRSSLYANFEYYPDMRKQGQFRSVTRAGWQILIDPELKMNLRTGFEHRYDSRSAAKNASVVDYFAVVGFSF